MEKKYLQKNVFFYHNIALSFYRNIDRQNRSSDEGLTVSNLQSDAQRADYPAQRKKLNVPFSSLSIANLK